MTDRLEFPELRLQLFLDKQRFLLFYGFKDKEQGTRHVWGSSGSFEEILAEIEREIDGPICFPRYHLIGGGTLNIDHESRTISLVEEQLPWPLGFSMFIGPEGTSGGVTYGHLDAENKTAIREMLTAHFKMLSSLGHCPESQYTITFE